MTEQSKENDVPLIRHIRNVKTGPSVSFWFKVAAGAVIVVALAVVLIYASTLPPLR